MPLRSMVLASIAGMLVLGTAVVQRTRAAEPAPHYVGSQACAECHDTEYREFAQGGHGRAVADSSVIVGMPGCESCHGPGSAHAEAAGDTTNPGYATIVDPRRQTPEQVTATCTTCHRVGEQFLWPNSSHANHKVSCIQCHSMHHAQDPGHQMMLKQSNTSELCLTCHRTKKIALARSAHMPLLEGGMNCASCHNPHGSTGPHMIRATSNNELCETCHTDKRGPMLWEHAPVRENCLTCHEPHGANNDKVLTGKRPFLCQRCHIGTRHPSTLYDAPDLASNRLFNRSCTNCHSQIHGSNDPSGKFFLR